jgi:hypothetical protein
MKNQKEIKINDFYQAVVLRTLGFPLVRLEKVSGKFFLFVFKDAESKAEETLSSHWDRKVNVVSKDFIENISELKTRIYTGI